MANAKRIVERILESERSVVQVYEKGTHDPFSAIYINGKLVVTNPRGDVSAVLEALGIEPQTLYVPYGFDGNFPELLTKLNATRS